jgi:DNA repair protein RecO (recombination protein O)
VALIKTEAIVLKQRDFSEADKIITLYSMKMGKISCIAKGIKRAKSKLRGTLLPFTHNSLVLFKGKSLYTVTGADIIESFVNLRKDFSLMAYTSYILELLDSLVPEEEASYQTFVLLVGTLHLLNVIDPRVAVKIFEIRFLRILGYRPQTDKCINCGGFGDKFWFSSGQGGVLCSSCRNLDSLAKRISTGSLKILELLDKMDWNRIDRVKPSKKNFQEMDHIMDDYLLYLLQKKLHSREFIKSVIENKL